MNQTCELHSTMLNCPLTDYSPYGAHGGWGDSPYSPHPNIPPQGHFIERYKSFSLLVINTLKHLFSFPYFIFASSNDFTK